MIYGGGWVMGIVVLLLVLLLVGAMLIGGIWLTGRNATAGGRQLGLPCDESQEVLRRRYASGEIIHQEYESMREHLSH